MSRPWFDAAAPRVIVLVLLFAVLPVTEAAHQPSLSNLANGDFWWHLRTGIGILESHALPHTGLYSQSSAMPWTATSWLYDMAVAIGFRVLDLRVIPLAAMACKLALAVVAFLLAGGLRGRFWSAVLLSAVAQFILNGLPPLPMYGSALLFAIELLLLMQSRREASVRPLYWLAPLFLLWANVDVQFVIGAIALLMFALTAVLERWGTRSGIAWLESPANPPLPKLGAAIAAALLATVLTPYGAGGYRVFVAQVTSAANTYFPDFQALRFRSPQDYLLLLLVGAAFLALGLRRSRDPFQIALLLLCTFASFYAHRYAWLAVIAAVAILGNAPLEPASQPTSESATLAKSRLLLAAGVAIALLAAAAVIHLSGNRARLLAKVGKAYPVVAADYIREHHLPQPLFNSFPWGGFLTWYLPEYPVAIDGRTDLYGDDFNIQYANVMNAGAHFSTLPALDQAGTLLLEKNSLMGTALATVPGFKVAYSDNVAVVLLREPSQP